MPDTVTIEREYRRMKIADLTPHPDNARTGDVDLIAESLRLNGQYRPIVVQKKGLIVLAGNHTMRGAERNGWDEIDTCIIDVDDEAARRILLVDNRANDVAGYDDRALANLLQGLTDTPLGLQGTGFADHDLADLLDILNVPSLDDLADKHGDHDPEAFWPVLRFKVSPQLRTRFLALTDGHAGSDADLFALVVGWAEAGK